MTALEIFIEFGKKHYNSEKINMDLIINDPEIKFIVDAIEAYGKQEYNQAIDDLIAEDVVTNRLETAQKFKKV